MTGLQEDCICTDLKPYLQDTKVTDEILLERLSIVYNMEMERKNYQLLVKDVKVTVVQDDEISTPVVSKRKRLALLSPTPLWRNLMQGIGPFVMCCKATQVASQSQTKRADVKSANSRRTPYRANGK